MFIYFFCYHFEECCLCYSQVVISHVLINPSLYFLYTVPMCTTSPTPASWWGGGLASVYGISLCTL